MSYIACSSIPCIDVRMLDIPNNSTTFPFEVKMNQTVFFFFFHAYPLEIAWLVRVRDCCWRLSPELAMAHTCFWNMKLGYLIKPVFVLRLLQLNLDFLDRRVSHDPHRKASRPPTSTITRCWEPNCGFEMVLAMGCGTSLFLWLYMFFKSVF